MSDAKYKSRIASLLAEAGVVIDGDQPWDIRVHDERLYHRVWLNSSLGFGEAYMEGWWDCDRLDALFDRVLSGRLNEKVRGWADFWVHLRACLTNMQSRRRAYDVGEQHYDLDNDLFERMLDSRMTYSCGYWREAQDLENAQRDKLDLICRKLHLAPGMRLLDIGCGWGGLLQYAAANYGIEGVGVTISREQAELARERCADLPVEIRLTDYRELDERFDAIASVGMFEHVGEKNYDTFMDVACRCLQEDGLFLLHSIGQQRTRMGGDPWLHKYIFPNGSLPSARRISESSEARFIMEDWHNFGPDYDRTLMAWHQNFEANWEALQDRYDERFHRMWRYYLCCCAGAFRSRILQLWQVVFSRCHTHGVYRSVR